MLAKKLREQITPDQEAEWKQGTPDDCAMEAFNIAFAVLVDAARLQVLNGAEQVDE